MMEIDKNRKLRNHVFNVRCIKDKYYVVVMIPKDDVKVEIEWDKWIIMTDKERQDI